MEQTAYPIQFSVDYPDRPVDRVSTLFRIFAAIPILIVLGSVSGATWRWITEGRTTVADAEGRLILIETRSGQREGGSTEPLFSLSRGTRRKFKGPAGATEASRMRKQSAIPRGTGTGSRDQVYP